MSATQILNVLERERTFLREFRSLSEQQLSLLETENMEAVNHLLHQRGELMLELTAVEATLSTWIDQIRRDPAIANGVLGELRTINADIVQIANQVVDIDDQSYWRLDLIKTQGLGSEAGRVTGRVGPARVAPDPRGKFPDLINIQFSTPNSQSGVRRPEGYERNEAAGKTCDS